MLSRRAFVSIAAGCSFAALAAGCARDGAPRRSTDGPPSQVSDDAPQEAIERLSTTFFCYDTVCSLTGWMTQSVLDEAVELCKRFDGLFSRTVEGSDVWRINTAGGKSVNVSYETAELIDAALGYCEESGGLFDITIGAVSSLWDFKEGGVPAPEQIAAALPHVGYRNVRVDGGVVTLSDPEASIDLGGIAKGYIADALIELLEMRGVEHACVNLGGNIAVLGGKEDGSAWTIGVSDPNSDAEDALVARTRMATGSVVTSGLNERRFELDGRSYWHILDPRTGYPVETELMSVTVASDRSIDGDGYTKPIFALGEAGAADLVAQHPDLTVLLVYRDGTVSEIGTSLFELK